MRQKKTQLHELPNTEIVKCGTTRLATDQVPEKRIRTNSKSRTKKKYKSKNKGWNTFKDQNIEQVSE